MRKFVTTFVLLFIGLGAAFYAGPAQAQEELCRQGFLNTDYELPSDGIVYTVTSWGKVVSRVVIASDGSVLSEKVDFNCGLVTNSLRSELSSEDLVALEEALEVIFTFEAAEDACVAALSGGARGWYASYEDGEKVGERVVYLPCLDFPGYAPMLEAEIKWWGIVKAHLPDQAE